MNRFLCTKRTYLVINKRHQRSLWKTRITFKSTVKGEGEKTPDRKFSVVVDSPLINKYSQIYEDVIEVNDQDVKDEASLRKYGEQYYRTSLCDMLEDSLEIQVEGKSDVPVQIFWRSQSISWSIQDGRSQENHEVYLLPNG